jgi:hypothetical protein
MTPRTARTLYLLALAFPLAVLAWVNAAEIGRWLDTGMCPGGPMDRAAAPCGLWGFVGVVMLGGRAAFVVVPVLGLWVVGATALYALTRRRAARRAHA